MSAFLTAFLLFSAFTEKPTAAEQTHELCLQHIKMFQAQLDSFQSLTEKKADARQMLARFSTVRVAFKRFEFMLEYLDNRHYPFFNGVNAVEMDDGAVTNAKPEGMQVIESELYNDSLNYSRILFLTKQLKYRTLYFYTIFKNASLRDNYIFEAMRFHFIRMETLNLVAFDSPKLRNNTAEIRSALLTFQTILGYYKNDQNAGQIKRINTDLQKTESYLEQKNFTSLDRLLFIKNYIQPLVKEIALLQENLNISFLESLYKVFRAVNLKALNIYDTDFLNARFYAKDKYHKDNPLYTALGKRLFFDKRLSVDSSMSCATCHQPAKAFTDGLPVSITNKAGVFQHRNTPTVLNAALQAAYFYDLAATSLETQVDHVMVNPLEFNFNYDEAVKRLKDDTLYVRLFGEAFPEYKNDAISSVSINTCISDFERSLIRLNSPFDQYMRGEITQLDPAVKRGFNLFMGKAQCGSCHFAPTFSGTAPPFYGMSESEVLGTTKVWDTLHPVPDEDIGRFKIMEYEPYRHAFKTSTVRNASLTAPYMHNGGFKTLDEVLDFYDRGGGAGLGLNVPNQTLPPERLNLSRQDKQDLISFMKALTDTSGIGVFQ